MNCNNNVYKLAVYKLAVKILLIVAVIALVSCTSLNESKTEEQVLEQPSTNNATLALLDNALRHTESGNLEAAAATLERALRIEPRNPQLWYRLALIRLDQGQHKLAANLAAKSSSFAANNAVLINKNRDLIELARSGNK